MTLLDRLYNYYNFENEERICFKIGNWLEDRIEIYRDDRIYSNGKHHNTHPLYWFWFGCTFLFAFSLIFPLQIIAYPYFWFCLLRYPYKINAHEFQIDDRYDYYSSKKMEEWCKENKIKASFIFKFFYSDILWYFEKNEEKHEVIGFRKEEDLVAFKIMWL